MYLSHRIHCHGNDNKQRRSPDIERDLRKVTAQEFGQDTNEDEVGGADGRQAGQDIVDIGGGVGARTDARNEAAVFAQVVRRFGRIEHDRRVEEREEHNQQRIRDDVGPGARREVRRQPAQNAGGCVRIGRCAGAEEAHSGHREHQQGRGEDRRDHAGGVDLERQEAALALGKALCLLAFRIVDDQPALRALDEHDEDDQRDNHEGDGQHEADIHRRGARLCHKVVDGAGQFGDDPGEDDQRDAVANAAGGDLLAHPHQHHRAAGQRDHARQDEEPGRNAFETHCGEAPGNREGLHQREHEGEVARILVELLAARFAFLLELFKGGRGRRHHLNDNGRGDVGHDVEGEDAHPFDGAAGEQVHRAENPAGLALEQRRILRRIKAGQRDIRP